ncbi:MAG: hypothetical protein IMZ51_01045 [Chloroflexi bacterium]|nr:hypothetical protein [Chloroflexota bacterium]
MFKGLGWSTFLFNYINIFLMILVIIFYAKERISKKYIPYLIIFICFFPQIVLLANTQTMEAFFFLNIPLIYFIFFKNKNNFNLPHFIMLILLSIVLVARYSYIFLVIFLLLFIYYDWLKNRKFLYFFTSISSFILVTVPLWLFSIKNVKVWPAPSNFTVLNYLANNGITSITQFGFWKDISKIVLNNFKDLYKILSNISNDTGTSNWLIFFIIIANILLLLFTVDKKIKKESLLVLIPEITILVVTVFLSSVYATRHLRSIYGFIPLNIFYFFFLITRLSLKKRTIIILFFFVLIIFSSRNTYKSYLEEKNYCISQTPNVELIYKTIEEYRKSEEMIIVGDFNAPIFKYNYNKDKFIRLELFPLDENEFKELSNNNLIDLWIINSNSYVFGEGYDSYLNNWQFDKRISGIYDQEWLIYIRK